MFINEGSVGTVIEKNTVDRNGFAFPGVAGPDGIHVNEPATTLTKNTANDNDDYGIEAVAGVTDGGGNKARDNGNPAQCLNVFCK